jgi:hypothetical protein
MAAAGLGGLSRPCAEEGHARALRGVALAPDLVDFLTLVAYEHLA